MQSCNFLTNIMSVIVCSPFAEDKKMQEKVEYCENSVNRFSTQFLYKWGRDNMNNCSLVYNGVSQATKWCRRERVLLSSILHTKGAQHFDRLLRFSIFTEIFVRVPIYFIAVNIRICSSLLIRFPINFLM